jgi:hypothetical protein
MLSLLRLDVEEYGSLVVPKKIHEYIVGRTGADKVSIATCPVIYSKADECVGCLSPLLMAFDASGEEVLPILWFEVLSSRGS